MLRNVRIVYGKELRETFRDRRTFWNAVVSPLLITPAFLAVVGGAIKYREAKSKEERHTFGVVGAASNPRTFESLKATPRSEWRPLSRQGAEEQIRSRKIEAAVEIAPDSDGRLERDLDAKLALLFDPGHDTSREAMQRVQAHVAVLGQKVVRERLKSKNLPGQLAAPFDVKETPVKGGGSMATMMLSGFLPYVLAMSALAGGIYAANDLVAGEKERGSLESLLVAPVSRLDLVLGKFATVATVCLMNSVFSVVGLLWPFYIRLGAFDWLAKGGLSLSFEAIFAIALVLLPLAVLFAALLLAISTFARNQKEAQTYLGPLMIVVMVPAMLSMMMKSEASMPIAFIPIFNITLIVKQALTSSIDPVFVAAAFGASLVYAALALLFATRLFQKESVLLKA
jgi:sodium transport system permease protein